MDRTFVSKGRYISTLYISFKSSEKIYCCNRNHQRYRNISSRLFSLKTWSCSKKVASFRWIRCQTRCGCQMLSPLISNKAMSIWFRQRKRLSLFNCDNNHFPCLNYLYGLLSVLSMTRGLCQSRNHVFQRRDSVCTKLRQRSGRIHILSKVVRIKCDNEGRVKAEL